MTSLDFLVIGTTTKDLKEGGYTLGGTATYAALTAVGLGLSTGVVTSAEPDVLDDPRLSGISYAIVPSGVTTSFRNVYDGPDRAQYVEAVASSIDHEKIPKRWWSTPLVLLGPLVDDVDEKLAARLRNETRHETRSQLIGASIQGWLRQWDANGLVSHRRWFGNELLPQVDVAFVSEQDISEADLLELWASMVPTLVVTMGSEGARVHHQGAWIHVAGYPVREVDPTGAGDVFATAFLVEYGETRDVIKATRFANSAASFVVEGVGTACLPTRSQIVGRMRDSKEFAM